jgi:SpoVK/Ycf46/Vps4 family AAA+-type ATPase
VASTTWRAPAHSASDATSAYNLPRTLRVGARKNGEHEANTSMKTEFMTMWDGFQTNEHARVMVLAATNRPWDVDEAILRRLPRSFEVGLPNLEAGPAG